MRILNCIDKFAEEVVNKPSNALMYVILTSLLPYAVLIALVILSLVTLRRGIRAGGQLFMAVMLLNTIIAAYYGELAHGLLHSSAIWGSTWLLAAVLRTQQSWSKLLTASIAIFAGMAMLIVSIDVNFLMNYQKEFVKSLDLWRQSGLIQVDQPTFESLVQHLSENMLGLLLISKEWVVLGCLMVARIIQSRLYNPGGFRQECLNLRLSKSNLLLFAIAVGLAFINEGPVSKAIMLITGVPLVFAGLSLLHWRVRRWSNGRWMVLLPCYVFLSVYPLAVLPLMVIAIADMWCNFRNFQSHAQNVLR